MNANYRIYDYTGGGVTEDIHAESLEAAIKKGRSWIEDGDWASENEDGEVVYRTIELDCGVREIVRYPETPGEGQTEDEDGDILDADGYIVCTKADRGEIDEDATIAGESHDCSGEYSDELPECAAKSDSEDNDWDGHDWRSPYSLVGGIKENPGVWSNGGTRMSYSYVCRNCGCYKSEDDPGSQRNPNEALSTIEIEGRDADSEAWLVRVHEEEDGFLPEWLHEFLDCSPSVRMDEEKAKEWVAENSDEDDVDEDELEHAFAAIMGRRATDEDRAEGLWSHLAA